MEREKEVVAGHDDEGRAGGAKPQEPQLVAKLRRGLSLAKRGGPCTPVCAWKLEEDGEEAGPSWANDRADATQNAARTKQHPCHRVSLAYSAAGPRGTERAVSARELGANLSEIQDPSHYRMSRRSARTRRHKDEKLADLSDLSPLGHREQVTVSNQAITPASSLDLKGRLGYSCKTSTELLKILNRIWSLEEQHTSTTSLVRRSELKLENAQLRIRELLREKQSNHHEIDSLMKQIAGGKLARKSKEQERIKATVKSLRAEVEDERRLRRHSESLHRSLAKELSEIKSAFLKMMRDLEWEKKAHNLLEDLCDEFVKGIREYEEEVTKLKQKSGCGHRHNTLILDFSQAWLDVRLYIKLVGSQGDLSEKKRLMDKLECEVEAFLEARRSCSVNGAVLHRKNVIKDRCLRRHSLESIHLNGAVSAPQYVEDEVSAASDSHCFELNMGTYAAERHNSLKHNSAQYIEKLEGTRNSNVTKKRVGSSEGFKHQRFSSSQKKIDGHTQSCNDVKVQFLNKIQGIDGHIKEGEEDACPYIDFPSCQKSEEGEAQKDAHDTKVRLGGTYVLNRVVDNPVIESEYGELCNRYSEGDQTGDSNDELCQHPSLSVGGNDATGSCHGLSSPLQQLSRHHLSPDVHVAECSKFPQGTKSSSLKAKLLEARLEGQLAHLKTSRGSAIGA